MLGEIERTDGVPLFVEELTKAVLELGLLEEGAGGCTLAGPLPPLAIPSHCGTRSWPGSTAARRSGRWRRSAP